MSELTVVASPTIMEHPVPISAAQSPERVIPARTGGMLISILERIVELPVESAVIEILHIWHISAAVFSETELRLFRHHLERNFRSGYETICHTLIVSPENQVKMSEFQRHLAVPVPDFGFLVEHRFYDIIIGNHPAYGSSRIHSISRTVIEGHGYP